MENGSEIMISFTIRNDELKMFSYFCINTNNGKDFLSGYTIKNNKIGKLEIEQLKLLNYFNLGSNGVIREDKDGKKIILDLDTGLYHYFENGKENIEKLFLYNGKNNTMASFFDRLDQRNLNLKYRIASALVTFTLLFDASILLNIVEEHANWKYDARYNNEVAHLSFESIFSGVTFEYEDESTILSRKVSKDIIKDYIYASTNLSEEEKDFLWNEELISDVIPFYNGNFEEILTQVKHLNLGIVSFSDGNDGALGYQNGDNLLYVRNYNGNLDEGNFKQIIGHEYIHLLQCSGDLYFIREASAEIIDHEYFLDSSDTSIGYSYSEDCKRLKVLMEIIGPEAIWDYNFNAESTSLQDIIKDYLSEQDYQDIMYIFSLSPFYDREELNSLYDKLDELLGKMYFNKFGEDISNNELISVIVSGGVYYNRPYFRKSLIEKDDARFNFYPVISNQDVQSEINKGNIVLSINCVVTSEEFGKLDSARRSMKFESGSMELLQSDVFLNGSSYDGFVTLKDNENNSEIIMDVNSAYKNGYINIVLSKTYHNLSVSEFFELYSNAESYSIWCKDELKELSVNSNGNFIDKKQVIVNYVPRIDEVNLDKRIGK